MIKSLLGGQSLKNTILSTTVCGKIWLLRLLWEQKIAGSNPVTPIERSVPDVVA